VFSPKNILKEIALTWQYLRLRANYPVATGISIPSNFMTAKRIKKLSFDTEYHHVSFSAPQII
jgi:hypothetical protein